MHNYCAMTGRYREHGHRGHVFILAIHSRYYCLTVNCFVCSFRMVSLLGDEQSRVDIVCEAVIALGSFAHGKDDSVILLSLAY